MGQNNNIVLYALMPAGGVEQAPRASQTYHHLPCALVGQLCYRRPDS